MQIWERPEADADMANSLNDAFVALPRGECLVYYIGKSGTCSRRVKTEAMKVSIKLGGALVQRTLSPKTEENRNWYYMIQKPT